MWDGSRVESAALPSTLTLTRLGSRVNAVRSKRRYLKDRPDREARLDRL